NMLQEYVLIPLDIYKESTHNKTINNKLEAWLSFLCDDSPERILEIVGKYPDFQEMYEEVYEICGNIEGVMDMFSKELLELDRNTVQYMIEEQQEQLDTLHKEVEEKRNELEEKWKELEEKKKEAEEKSREVAEKNKELEEKSQEVAEKNKELEEKKKEAEEKNKEVEKQRRLMEKERLEKEELKKEVEELRNIVKKLSEGKL
ncbi:hypothetical protein A8806_111216, partial [Faecalicatena orotica]